MGSSTEKLLGILQQTHVKRGTYFDLNKPITKKKFSTQRNMSMGCMFDDIKKLLLELIQMYSF